MKRRVFCRVRPVSTLAAEPQGAPSPRVSSLPCLETLRYDGAQSTTLATSQDSFDSEGKFGIPRFSGEPAQLPEYAFRVQMRMLREKGMEESELKKVGPLGIRLVEGLRGQALRLAQQLKPEDLAKQSGPETLLKLFNDTLKPSI